MQQNDDACANQVPEDSPLLRSLGAALSQVPIGSLVRVSIEKSGAWVDLHEPGGRAWARFLCWNLVSPEGAGLTEPVLAMVHGDLTGEMLAVGIRQAFPDVGVVVDNDITFS